MRGRRPIYPRWTGIIAMYWYTTGILLQMINAATAPKYKSTADALAASTDEATIERWLPHRRHLR